MQNQTNLKYSSNPKDIFKSAKKNQKNLTPSKDFLKLQHLKFQAKFLTEKNPLKKQYNFCKAMISLEVRDMSQEAKFLRVRKFQGNNTTFVWLRFLQNFTACSEALTPQISWNPPSAKIFKTIIILKIYTHPLFPKPFFLPPHPGPKTF